MSGESTALAAPRPAEESAVAVDPTLLRLKKMVVDSMTAANSKRNYAAALDHMFAFAAGRPLSRELLLEWRASMDKRSASTINVKLSAMRGLVGEARRAGILSADEAARLTEIPNIKQAGTRKGNWLTRDQARELLTVPDRSKLRGKRDYVVLSLLLGCALRRTELAELDVATIQQREGRWVLADLEGKGRRIRTVAIPLWVKQGIDEWMTAACIQQGRVLRRISKSGKPQGHGLSDWAVWFVVEQAARQIGVEQFGAHDLRRTCAKLCRKAGGDLEQIKFMLGHSSIQTTERYLGSEQELAIAVNDSLGL